MPLVLCIVRYGIHLTASSRQRLVVLQLPGFKVICCCFPCLVPNKPLSVPKLRLAVPSEFHSSSWPSRAPCQNSLRSRTHRLVVPLSLPHSPDTAPTLACLLLQVAKEFPGYEDGPFPGEAPCNCLGAQPVTSSGMSELLLCCMQARSPPWTQQAQMTSPSRCVVCVKASLARRHRASQPLCDGAVPPLSLQHRHTTSCACLLFADPLRRW